MVEYFFMITKSVPEARRNLSGLIDLVTEISDRQAGRLWELAASEPGRTFRPPLTAVRQLKKPLSKKR